MRRFKYRSSIIVEVAVDEVPTISVGHGSAAGDVVISVDVSDVVKVVDLGRYRRPSSLHLHCSTVDSRRKRQPSDGSSATRDRTTVVG